MKEHTNTTQIEAKPFTAKKVNALAGLTYRQLNDWERKGILPPGRTDQAETWRRFSLAEVFGLMLLASLRRQFNVPLENLEPLSKWLFEDSKKPFKFAVRTATEIEAPLVLLTDLETTFMILSSIEAGIKFRSAFYERQTERGFLIISVTAILEKLLSGLDELIPKNQKLEALLDFTTPSERQVLNCLREDRYKQLQISRKKDKKLLLRKTVDVSADNLENALEIFNSKPFATITLNRRDGQQQEATLEETIFGDK